MSEATTFWTSTGIVVDVLEADPSKISIFDIAASLSRQCRFAGHLAPGVEHYSVAQHSILVARLCPSELALIGLLHDATEAYLQDIIRPLKHALGPIYQRLEEDWAMAIARAFGLPLRSLSELPPVVKAADQLALQIERRTVANVRGELFAEPLEFPAAWAAYGDVTEKRIPERLHGFPASEIEPFFLITFDGLKSGKRIR
jgi:hypothetical protein